MSSNPDWGQLRTQFPTLADQTYLCSCSLGLPSQRTRRALERYLELWTNYGASAWPKYWLEEVTAAKREFAKLINADPGEIAVMPNISSALTSISSSLDLTAGSRIVSCDLDFPTVTHHFLAKARHGVETVVLGSEDQIKVDLDQFEAAINDATALVATSRVFFTSGYIQDVGSLAEIVHQKGKLLLVDDYQGTGQVPIDVKAKDIDILVTGGLKWLLGGSGIAYMYVRQDLIQRLSPTTAGWFGHRDQFAFDPHEMVFRDDAGRFEAGTPSISAVYAGAEGLRMVNELGSEVIRERNAYLTGLLVSQLSERGFQLRIPDDPRRHATITMVEMEDPAAVVDYLAEHKIIVDARPGAIRVSPYFYNNEEDIEQVIESLVTFRSKHGG